MKGKYCDYYWSVKKESEGYVWYIRTSYKRDAEVVECSKENNNPEDRFYDTPGDAASDARHAIQDYYI